MSSVRQILVKYEYTNVVAFAERAQALGYTFSFWADGENLPQQVSMPFHRIRTGSTTYNTVSTRTGEVSDECIINEILLQEP
jgi:hypothetical protein